MSLIVARLNEEYPGKVEPKLEASSKYIAEMGIEAFQNISKDQRTEAQQAILTAAEANSLETMLQAIEKMYEAPFIGEHYVARKNLIKEHSQGLIESNNLDTVINLGCGIGPSKLIDSTNMPDVTFYEVDRPETIEYKAVLSKDEAFKKALGVNGEGFKNVEFVAADFNNKALKQILEENNIPKDSKPLINIEGVSMYLTKDQIKSTIETLNEYFNDGCHICIGVLDNKYMDHFLSSESAANLASSEVPLKFAMDKDKFVKFVEQSGYKVLAHSSYADIQANMYDRDIMYQALKELERTSGEGFFVIESSKVREKSEDSSPKPNLKDQIANFAYARGGVKPGYLSYRN